MQERKYLPVNWKDGMKINKSHFISQENAFTYQQAQHTASQLNDYNFGLLPTLLNNGDGVKFFLRVDNEQQLQLRLRRCLAITKGGHFIEFEEDTALYGNNLHAELPGLSIPFQELTDAATTYYIVLTIDPYKRVAHGLADPHEQPARVPFTMPAFNLSLVPEQFTTKNLLGLYQLPLGKLKIDGHKLSLDDKYIPPCSSVSSHEALLATHAILELFYAKMEIFSLQIIQKIFQKKQDNEMAFIVQKLCENITFLTATHFTQLKTLCLHRPPVEMVCLISSFARMFKNTLDQYLGTGKEELVNYFTLWCEVNQAELEASITSLSNHPYDHYDLDGCIQKIALFTQIMLPLFEKLAGLDYIGKRKEVGIFVKEKIVDSNPDSSYTKRKSFLA